jgi:hypothetical protein
MKNLINPLIAFLSISLAACTGTDFIDDLTVEKRIELKATQIALKQGDVSMVMAEYFDEFGVKKMVQLQYSSSNTQSVEVDQQGKITALANGRSVIEVSYQGTIAPPLNVNVVSSTNDVAIVEIVSPGNTLNAGDKVQINLTVKNINGDPITGRPIEWFSENTAILTVNASGEVTAIADGVASIHAKVDGVKSNSLNLTVGKTSISGSFVSAGGYQAAGKASLTETNGLLTLQLASDFKTSFALGTYVYLANSTNASQVRSSGLEISQITTNGAHNFNVSALYPQVKLKDYRYVIILCKPATVTFGYADLK